MAWQTILRAFGVRPSKRRATVQTKRTRRLKVERLEDRSLLAAMAAGVMPGSWLGSRFTLRARNRLVLTLFAALLAATGIIFMASELRAIFA